MTQSLDEPVWHDLAIAALHVLPPMAHASDLVAAVTDLVERRGRCNRETSGLSSKEDAVMHPDIWLECIKAHQRELWREAERLALVRQAQRHTFQRLAGWLRARYAASTWRFVAPAQAPNGAHRPSTRWGRSWGRPHHPERV